MKGMTMLMRAVFMAGVLLPMACRSVAGGSSLDIVGGKVVQTHERIARHTLALLEATDPPEEFCTGVLIEKDIVLTAAHCFRVKRNQFAVSFGTQLPTRIDDSSVQIVQHVLLHPEFSPRRLDSYDKRIKDIVHPDKIPHPGKALYDLALVLLEKPLPAGASPVGIAQDLSDLKSLSITTAGFGCRSTECLEISDRLRKVSMRWAKTLESANTLVLSVGTGKGTCSGDSGGPDFIERSGEWELLSIVGTGPDSCELGISIDTLIQPYQAWIKEGARQLREQAGQSAKSRAQ